MTVTKRDVHLYFCNMLPEGSRRAVEAAVYLDPQVRDWFNQLMEDPVEPLQETERDLDPLAMRVHLSDENQISKRSPPSKQNDSGLSDSLSQPFGKSVEGKRVNCDPTTGGWTGARNGELAIGTVSRMYGFPELVEESQRKRREFEDI